MEMLLQLSALKRCAPSFFSKCVQALSFPGRTFHSLLSKQHPLLFPLPDFPLPLPPGLPNTILFPCIVCLMGSLMSVALPFWNAQSTRQKLDYFLDCFHPSVVCSSLLLFHSATQLKFAEPERRGRRYERGGNLPSHCFRKSLLATCPPEETRYSKDTTMHLLFAQKPKVLSIRCRTESNYQDNDCYLHCPTVVFCNQKLFWQVWVCW